MSRILALDYGRKRTGIAVSDTLQIIANGLVTISTHDLMSYLQEYVKKEPVERIIIGLPKQTNNKDSEIAGDVRAFVRNLKQKLTDVPVEFVDERFTSVLAHRTMIDAGLRKMARRNKELVDEISATIILQTYLESRRLKQ